VLPVIRPTLLWQFLARMRRASPVAQLTLVTMPSLPPRWRDSALQLVCAEPCSLRLRPKSSTSRVVISRLPHVRFRYRLVTRNHPLMALSVGFRVSVSLHPATQATGPRLLPRWDYLPLSVPAFPGRTGLLSVHSRYGLQTRRVAYATLYTRGLGGFVTSTAAPVATGWSDPVPGRVFLPLWTNAFSRRTVISQFR
jgi:hypothetical protein